MSKKLVVGRVETVNGITGIAPIHHAEETYEYQKSVRELVEAARTFRDEYSPANVQRLLEAAKRVK